MYRVGTIVGNLTAINRFFILCLIILMEIACHAIFPIFLGYPISSILYIICGILLPIQTALFFFIPAKRESQKFQFIPRKFAYLLFFLLACIILYYCESLFEMNAIDYKVADMLPVIDRMCQRFLINQEVYAIIPEIWDGIQPVYLPAMWLPFCISTLFEWDLRWISVLALMTGIFLSHRSLLLKNKLNAGILMSVVLPLLVLLISILILDNTMITLTEEPIIIGYYLILGFAIANKRWILCGLVLALCISSRFIIVPWLIIWMCMLLFLRYRYIFTRVTIPFIVVTSVLFIGTDAFRHIELFFTLPDHYLQSVLGQQEKYRPIINESLGIAKFLPFQNLGVLHNLMLVLSVAIPLIGLIHYSKLKHLIPFHIYSLILLKSYLVVIYNTLSLPYSYLFYTSTFFSLTLLVSMLQTDVNPEDPNPKNLEMY